MSTKNMTVVFPTAEDAVKSAQPVATPLTDIPVDPVTGNIDFTVALVEGQSRTKYEGFLDEAKTIQVNLYYPSGMDIPADGQVLVVADQDESQGQSRTRKGSTKLAWGNLSSSDSYGAAAFVPRRLRFLSITARTA